MRFLVVVVLLVGIYWLCGRRSRSEYYSSVVFVNGTAPIARTDSDFVCATLDWWPPQKCDYTACSWGSASLLNLDLNNPTLINAVRAFSPLKIRLGGTLQDKVVYQETENEKQPCTPFVKNDSALFGFSQGCLSMSRWDELNNFFNKTRAFVVFGLNALTGKIISSQGSATGAWDSSNAESLIRYTVEKGYTIHGWELGNELSGSGIGIGIGARISPGQYASDINRLQDIVQQVYAGFEAKPLVLGPGGFFDRNWFTKFISKTPKSLQVVTHHIYNLGPGSGEHLIEKILNPSVLGSVSGAFESLQSILKRSRSSAVAWVGEAGGAYNSGQNHVTNAFVFSFWYLDQLGMAATYDTKAYCRQSLIGGNYGLLNTNTFVPNPDYYSALLWHRLMGTNVLSARFSGTAKVRSYAHCTKKTQGITLLLINLEKSTTVHVSVSIEKASSSKGSNVSREEYHLTPRDGDLHSQTVLLNGKVLSIDPLGNIPPLEPIQKLESDPITVAPFSIVFAIIPNVNVPACN